MRNEYFLKRRSIGKMRSTRFLAACCALILSTACAPTPSEESTAESGNSEELPVNPPTHEHESTHEEDHEGLHEADDHDDHTEESEGAHTVHQHEDAHHERREHGTHEHGRATLTVAWSKKDLAIDLQTPAYNILGFEYAPSTTAEKKWLLERVETLKTEDLIEPSAEAKCAVVDVDVQTEFGAENKPEEEKTNHSDFDVFYTVQCQNPDALRAIDTGGLFAAFSNLTTLQVQWISDRGQSAQTLTPKHPILLFD